MLEHYDVAADLWSATSYKSLREEAVDVERWNRLHPADQPRIPFATEALSGGSGPVVAVSDYMKAVPDQIGRWIPRRFIILGTDGFGRSDTREALRNFFEVDTGHVVVGALSGLAAEGLINASVVQDAIKRYEIDTEIGNPFDR